MPHGRRRAACIAAIDPLAGSPPQAAAIAASQRAGIVAGVNASPPTGARRITCAGLKARTKRGANASSSKSTGQRCLGDQRAISAR